LQNNDCVKPKIKNLYNLMQKTIFITGATSGFGKACAHAFATDHHRLILTGRRADRLKTEADTLTKMYGIEVLILNFDVRDRDAVKQTVDSIPEDWQNIDILINNAGLAAGSDPIQDGNMDDWDAMIDTNIKGLLYVTKNIFPLMLQSKCPHIVNIGSIAGKEVYARGNVYCATKFAVDALTRAMRIDMLSHAIKVSQVAPGAAETEFSQVRFKGDMDAVAHVYKGFAPLQAEDIASAVIWITGLPEHVNINDLVIMPTAQASPGYIHKML
jgi:3-hydroxy acid dehydrogenase/malonic semialdehyde reductase